MDEARAFVFENCDKIAINNRHLEPFYRKIGYSGKILHLDNWVRSDLFLPNGDDRRDGLIGYQSDNRAYSILDSLQEVGEVLSCEGAQAQVASAMKRCGLFAFWNRHADCFKEVGLQGETFGLSLFEAMACGCAVIARRHDGVADILPAPFMFNDLGNAIKALESLVHHPDSCDALGYEASKLIEFQYRWDDRRRSAVEELLS
jgi:glycosyltransferase involved in cell wall biosynthesis